MLTLDREECGLMTGDGVRPTSAGRQRPPMSAVSVRMRSVLSLASAARVAMARRLQMSVNDLQAVEHVMTAGIGTDAGTSSSDDTGTGGGEEPTTVGPSELARLLGVSTAAMTQSLQRLEADGHVCRRPHRDDRRRQVVEVTPDGAHHVFQTLSPLLQMLEAQAAQLSPAEQRAVLKFLDGQQHAYQEFLVHLAARTPPSRPSSS